LRSRRIDAVQEFSHGGRAMIHRIELDVDFLEVTQRHDDGDYSRVKMCVLSLHLRSFFSAEGVCVSVCPCRRVKKL
jgi:hypothetical protein